MIFYNDPSRPQFEEWLRGTSGFKACAKRGKPMSMAVVIDGSYRDFRVNDRWHAWCAALRIVGESK